MKLKPEDWDRVKELALAERALNKVIVALDLAGVKKDGLTVAERVNVLAAERDNAKRSIRLLENSERAMAETVISASKGHKPIFWSPWQIALRRMMDWRALWKRAAKKWRQCAHALSDLADEQAKHLLDLENFVLLLHLDAQVTEGRAAKLLGVDRITLRERMINRYGDDWRDAADDLELRKQKMIAAGDTDSVKAIFEQHGKTELWERLTAANGGDS